MGRQCGPGGSFRGHCRRLGALQARKGLLALVSRTNVRALPSVGLPVPPHVLAALEPAEASVLGTDAPAARVKVSLLAVQPARAGRWSLHRGIAKGRAEWLGQRQHRQRHGRPGGPVNVGAAKHAGMARQERGWRRGRDAHPGQAAGPDLAGQREKVNRAPEEDLLLLEGADAIVALQPVQHGAAAVLQLGAGPDLELAKHAKDVFLKLFALRVNEIVKHPARAVVNDQDLEDLDHVKAGDVVGTLPDTAMDHLARAGEGKLGVGPAALALEPAGQRFVGHLGTGQDKVVEALKLFRHHRARRQSACRTEQLWGADFAEAAALNSVSLLFQVGHYWDAGLRRSAVGACHTSPRDEKVKVKVGSCRVLCAARERKVMVVECSFVVA